MPSELARSTPAALLRTCASDVAGAWPSAYHPSCSGRPQREVEPRWLQMQPLGNAAKPTAKKEACSTHAVSNVQKRHAAANSAECYYQKKAAPAGIEVCIKVGGREGCKSAVAALWHAARPLHSSSACSAWSGWPVREPCPCQQAVPLVESAVQRPHSVEQLLQRLLLGP
jgi:hypothetical protein